MALSITHQREFIRIERTVAIRDLKIDTILPIITIVGRIVAATDVVDMMMISILR